MREGKRRDSSSSSSSSSLLNRDFFSRATMSHCFAEEGWAGGKTTGIVECMSLIHYPHFLRFKTSTVIIAVLTYINTTVISFGERSTYDIYPQQAAETQRLCMSVWLCVFIGSGMHLCICVSVEHWRFIQETVLFTPCRAPTIWQAGWHSLLTSLTLAKSATPQCCLMLIKTWSTKQTVSEKRKKKHEWWKKRSQLLVFLFPCGRVPYCCVVVFEWHCCSERSPLQKPHQSESPNPNIMARVTHQRGRASRERCWPTRQTNKTQDEPQQSGRRTSKCFLTLPVRDGAELSLWLRQMTFHMELR